MSETLREARRHAEEVLESHREEPDGISAAWCVEVLSDLLEALAREQDAGEVVMGFVVKGFGRSPRDIEMDRGPLRSIANRMKEGDRVLFRLLPFDATTPTVETCGTCEGVGYVATDGIAGVPHTIRCPDCGGDDE